MRLSDCFIELIAYVLYLTKNLSSRQPSCEEVRTDIQRLITESQTYLQEGTFAKEDYELAQFAVFSWVDEALLASPWNDKSKWQLETLQRIYYKMSNAGEIFFDRLNEIGPHQRDVREVFYLCLAMGFAGRYCHPGDEFLLAQLKTNNLKLLTGGSVSIPSFDKDEIFPEAYPIDDETPQKTKSYSRFSPYMLLALVSPVLLYIVLFVIYRFILGNIGENFLNTVP